MRYLLVGTLFALLGVSGCTGPSASSPVEAEESHPFLALAQHCKTFDQASFWTRPRRSTFIAYVHRSGKATLERASGRGARYHWDGQTATYDHHNFDAPEVLPDWGARLADVWRECRSGFANTRWVEESPALYGGEDMANSLLRWARLELPFDWADGLLVFVVTNGRETPIMMEVGYPGALQRIVFHDFTWHATLPDDKLTPHASETVVPHPPLKGGPYP